MVNAGAELAGCIAEKFEAELVDETPVAPIWFLIATLPLFANLMVRNRICKQVTLLRLAVQLPVVFSLAFVRVWNAILE